MADVKIISTIITRVWDPISPSVLTYPGGTQYIIPTRRILYQSFTFMYYTGSRLMS